MASFGYASDGHGVPVATHGVSRNWPVVKALAKASSAEEVFRIEGEALQFNPERAQRLYTFLRQFAERHNTGGDRLRALHALQPPHQNYDLSPGLRWLEGRQIRELTVTEVTTFYDGARLAAVRELLLARLTVPLAPPD